MSPTKHWNPFSIAEWIAWLGATVVATACALVFIYSTFQTQSQAQVSETNVARRIDQLEVAQERRLERIENKLDLLLERR